MTTNCYYCRGTAGYSIKHFRLGELAVCEQHMLEYYNK